MEQSTFGFKLPCMHGLKAKINLDALECQHCPIVRTIVVVYTCLGLHHACVLATKLKQRKPFRIALISTLGCTRDQSNLLKYNPTSRHYHLPPYTIQGVIL